MRSSSVRHSPWVRVLAGIAILFGIATIIAGGRTLFDAETRRLAGNYVAFVLWFNFVMGFAYVVGGIGLWGWQRWSAWFALAIGTATLVVAAAFGMQIWLGGSYEMRTVVAMVIRTVFWLAIAAITYRQLPNPRSRAAA